MTLDQVEKAGFIGGGYVVTQPDPDSPYSPITGYGRSGTLHRWDGQSFAWRGANPFGFQWDDKGNFKNGGPPSCINVVDVPGAPKNVPGARTEVWFTGPQLSVYAGQVLGQSYYRSPPWLYPIGPGEVLWLSFDGGGFADERDRLLQPEVNIQETNSFAWTLAWNENIEWVWCSLDGKKVLVLVKGWGYFEADVTAVTRTDNVGNPKRLNQTRYDVQIAVKQVANILPRYSGTSGGAAFLMPEGVVKLVETQEAFDSDSVISAYQGVLEGTYNEDDSQPSVSLTLSQYWRVVTLSLEGRDLVTFKYGQQYVSACTIDGESIQDYMAGSYTPNLEDRWWESYHGLPYGALMRVYYKALAICGESYAIEDMGRPFLSSLMRVGIVEVPQNGVPDPTFYYIDAVKGSLIPDDHIIRKVPNARHLRALSPDYLYLSDNPDDQSFFFT
ncbi:hypothetical protein NH8B_2121 [Pseudogulbenkiania sp. NH8B]|uniref:hypothetical protein n=1 Tax=Pseudogulbenkiania sp. (strain NH8B) TaxID=748280 RepID=UPI0002279BBD|nr:hypothetical protein [Pseudogulbenkiania sp. NH8B]BAK76507.1 hypothetical protein NH8B_1690 [Pseudogulbenkiania sp. NH8B]BAK76936.1 hypothetical protein NH8B_2121 [Pseudogulbenkiania sp. NH8B]